MVRNLNLTQDQNLIFLKGNKIVNEEKDDHLFEEVLFYSVHNPRLLIVEYFNSLCNQIDIRSEKIILQYSSSEIDIALIEKTRDHMIQTIEEIKKKNLENISIIKTEIIQILNKNTLTKNEFLFYMNLIFKYFCVLVDLESLFIKTKISNSLGVLVMLDGYLPIDQLKIYKKFINNLNKTNSRKDSGNCFNNVRT